MKMIPRPRSVASVLLPAAGLALIATSSASAASAPASSSSSSSTPPTAAYTDQPMFNTTSSFSSNYGIGGFSSFGSSWGPSYSSSFRSVYLNRIFFPPTPPALGQLLPHGIAVVRPSTPSNLSTYISELFAPPLSSLLHAEELSKRRQARIDDYRDKKQKELAELRAKLDELQGADAARRADELANFARAQSPRLRDLEAAAEAIREELVRGGIFSTGVDWNDSRDWRLGDNLRYESYLDEFKVVRASAYFQSGLSVAQRHLLRELAMELSTMGNDPTAEISLDNPGPFFFFQPDTARVRLPVNLPAALSAKLDDFRARKEALKKELRDTLYKQDRAWFNYHRTTALRQLADQQAPRFADLDALAEEIRADLATQSLPDEPLKSPLPKELGERVTVFLQKKIELHRAYTSKLNELRAALPSDRVERGAGATLVVIAARNSSKAIQEKRASLQSSLAAFNADQGQRFAALAAEKESLRAEILKASEASTSRSNKSVDQLLAEFSRSFAQQENWNRYREYRVAVLKPGLSIEQRRLLYGAALETLQQGMSFTSI